MALSTISFRLLRIPPPSLSSLSSRPKSTQTKKKNIVVGGQVGHGGPLVAGRSVGGLVFAMKYVKETGRRVEVVHNQLPLFPGDNSVVVDPCGMMILRDLGVDKDVIKAGCVINKKVIRSGSSKEKNYCVVDMEKISSKYAQNAPTVGISSSVLVDVLQKKAQEMGIPTRSKSLSKVVNTPQGVQVSFKGGKYPKSNHSCMVVATAEGTSTTPASNHSLNATLFGIPDQRRKMETGQYLPLERYDMVLPIPDEVSEDKLVQVMANGLFIDWYPINDQYLSVTLMNSSKMGQWFKSGTAVPASEFLEKFEDKLHGNSLSRILAQINKHTHITTSFPSDNPPEKFVVDQCIRIGSSVCELVYGKHIETGLEIEDGAKLAEKLAKEGAGEGVLKAFGEERGKRWGEVAERGRKGMERCLKVKGGGGWAFSDFGNSVRYNGYFQRNELVANIRGGKGPWWKFW